MVLFCKPRVCGEKSSGSVCMPGHAGSPPRMRGKVIHSLCDRPQRGITPAYAGKRVRCSQQALPCTDHPRMCGEKVSQRPFRAVSAGSPPRMRGKARHDGADPVFPGITPAYAGKSLFSGLYIRINGDHPRVCGEKFLLSEPHSVGQGSPPRMRGKD